MKSTLRSSLKRLERLEAARRKQAEAAGRMAFIVIGPPDGETHLVLSNSDRGTCWFIETPGPGPQLADFGEFSLVVHFTEDEARL
jgi:hypothetical protein